MDVTGETFNRGCTDVRVSLSDVIQTYFQGLIKRIKDKCARIYGTNCASIFPSVASRLLDGNTGIAVANRLL